VAIPAGRIRCGAQLPTGAPGYRTGMRTCDGPLFVGDRSINRRRLTFVAGNDDGWIGYCCPRRECGQRYRTTYDELLDVQRAAKATGTDYRAVRDGDATRLVPVAQRASQMAVRATGVSAGRVPLPR